MLDFYFSEDKKSKEEDGDILTGAGIDNRSNYSSYISNVNVSRDDRVARKR